MDKEKLNCFFCEKNVNDYTIELDCVICPTCLEEQKAEIKKMEDNRTQFYPEINKITDKIYLGNQDAARDKKLLKEMGITHVLVCAAFIKEFHPEDFVYKSIPIDDDIKQDITGYLKECIEFIENGQTVFLHCHAGVSRSASVTIAYLMWKERLKFNDAKEFVKTRRPSIFPNSGFETQLTKFEMSLINNNFLI
jgi:protein-tyrosine phosphatase